MMCDADTLSKSHSSILEWLEKISSEVSSLSRSSSAADFVEQNTSETIGNDKTPKLKSLLEDSIKGRFILAHYNQNISLNSANQKELCHIICDFHKSKTNKMSYAEMQNWANCIEHFFTNEKSVSITIFLVYIRISISEA